MKGEFKNKSKISYFIPSLIVLFVLCIVFSGAVSAAGLANNTTQPKFHHDNNNTGQSQYTGPATNATKWKYQTGDYIFSSPAIGKDGTIYIGSDDGYLYAINKNGTLTWKYQTGTYITSSPAIGNNGTIYVGCDDGYLYAINKNGTLTWKYQTGNSIYSSSPSIGSDGTIYIGSYDYCLYAINSNGTLKWRYQTGNYIISSPAIGNDGTIYIGCLDDYLYAINSNGTLKWKYQTGNIVVSSPSIGSDGTIYVGSDDHYLYAINSNGNLKWRYQTGNYITSSPAIGNDGTIYIGSFDRYLYAINSNGILKWKYQTGDIVTSSPSIGSDGTIYVGSYDHYLYAINSNGTLKWNYQTGYCIASSPAIGNDRTVYIGSYDHYLYAISDIKVSASPGGGTYTGSKQVTLKTNLPGTVYYEVYNSDYDTDWAVYTSPINIKNSCNLTFYAVDSNGNESPTITETYYISHLAPIISASLNSGMYTSKQTVILTTTSDIATTTYYTLDGSDPQTSSTKQVYNNPVTILKSTSFRFSAVDSMGNWSPEYYQTYVIDTTPPKISIDVPGGYYNTNKNLTLTTTDPDSDFTTYYTTDGTDPQTSASRTIYSSHVSISKNTTLRYIALDTAGNWSPNYTQTYVIDTVPPTATANPVGGTFNTTKSVTLKMSDAGTIYYTINGTKPTKTSLIYKNPITISNTTMLKYMAVDLAGNLSPVYSQTYTIDKTAPKVSSTTPKNNQINVSRSTSVVVKFSENIKTSRKYGKITLKNLTTGKTVTIKVSITKGTMTVKPTNALGANTSYQLIIPASAVKDNAGNNLIATYSMKFKTGK